MNIETNKRYRLEGEAWLEFRNTLKTMLEDQQIMPSDSEPYEFKLKYTIWWSDESANLYETTKNEGFSLKEIDIISESILKIKYSAIARRIESSFYASEEGNQEKEIRKMFLTKKESLDLKLKSIAETQDRWRQFTKACRG